MDRRARLPMALILSLGGLATLAWVTGPLADGRFVVAGDGHYVFATARSVAFDGDLDVGNQLKVMGDRWGLGLDPAADGFRFPPREIGPSLLMVPGLWLHRALGLPGTLEPTVAVAPVAASLGPLFLLLARLLDRLDIRAGGEHPAPGTRGRRNSLVALAATLGGVVPFYAVGQPAYPHAGDSLVCTLLAMALFEARPAARVGPWLALALLFRLQNALWLLWLLADPRRGAGRPWARPLELLAVTAIAGLGLLPQLVTGLRHPGSSRGPIRWGRDFFDLEGLPTDLFEVLGGVHGLFTWTPVALLGTLGLLLASWRGSERAPARAALLVTAALVLLMATVRDPHMGHAFGARRLAGLTPLLAVGLSWLLDAMDSYPRARAWTGGLIAAGVGVNLLRVAAAIHGDLSLAP